MYLGYTAQQEPIYPPPLPCQLCSPQVKWLAGVMSSLDPGGRRQFLRFVTGTPRLPIGGFGALRPRLTVVKKEVDVLPGGTPDSHLPSCSTCQVRRRFIF